MPNTTYILNSGFGAGARITVNSLYQKATDRLALSVRAEARVTYGIIEAGSQTNLDQLLLAVQWHLEHAVV